MQERIIMTQEGRDKLQAELDHLILVRRKEVAQHLKEAVEFGDLSENAEYAAARIEQNDVETKINILSDKLSRSELATSDMIDKKSVHIGCKVKVLDELDEEVEYTVVGQNEGDVYGNKLSSTSPVGKALMGKKAGNNVEITLPLGETITYKILKVIPY